jgi:hypothetical protein
MKKNFLFIFLIGYFISAVSANENHVSAPDNDGSWSCRILCGDLYFFHEGLGNAEKAASAYSLAKESCAKNWYASYRSYPSFYFSKVVESGNTRSLVIYFSLADVCVKD